MNKILTALLIASAPAFALAQQGQAPDLDQMFFQQFDTNGDGRVDKQEFLRPTEQQFDHMDRDENGVLDPDEVRAFNQEMQRKMQELRQKMQQQGMPRR